MNIGEKLRKLRKDNGLTLKELSKQAGLSISFISDIENGRRNPRLENLDKLAKALKVDVSILLGEDESAPNPGKKVTGTKIDELEEEFPEGVYVLRRASKELSPEAKKQMIKIMKTFLEEEDDE